ncbi:MAG: type II toxin-antitoxin system HipA family toxin [Proteobacteria bacterium]|nr:type II toxin-antitoxin system HipA family toxin [Pseudomonadota bacterium]
MADIDVYLHHKTDKNSPLETQRTGRLSKLEYKHVFSYYSNPEANSENSEQALSLTMPLRTESYSYPDLHPLFQMNLPEGHLRQAIERATAKKYGSDDLTMLTLLGTNQIGRLSYAIAGEPLQVKSQNIPDLKSLLNSEDANLFVQLLQQYATSSGVAGVQPKVLMDIKTKIEGKATLPLQSYIVKSWGNEYPELGCNEFACLTLAKAAGLPVADFYLSDNAKLLISKRFDYDRVYKPLGFEDFCVLQAKITKEKYDASIESCANTIVQFVSPIFRQRALYDFFKLTLVNVLVRNGDAHLKNIGIIYKDLYQYKQGQLPKTERKLAPFFDIVSTVPYIPADTMALSLTGSKRWPKWKVLQKFANQHCGLNTKRTNQALEEVMHAREKGINILVSLAEKHPAFSLISEVMQKLINSGI